MSRTPPLPLAVLISGRGSNMAAIARACAEGRIAARIVRVIADRRNAGGLALARESGLDCASVPAREHADAGAFEAALEDELEASGARLVALAGFMRILSPAFTRRHAGALLNIHPSLLPKYPGLRTHERALAAGERQHGASVHYVTGELDAGPIVLQARVPVLPGDTVASLAARVLQQEHVIYPEVIGWIAAGRLELVGGVPWLDGRPLHEPVMAA